jgi:hypothetical protein
MRLEFLLYGLPGVGKLTVASELAILTHPKVSTTTSRSTSRNWFSPFASPSCGRLVLALRREVFAQAADENVDLIFTIVYVHLKHQALIHELVQPVVSRGGDGLSFS